MIKHVFFQNMETDNEEHNNMNLVMELEETTEMVDEAKIHVSTINLDEVLCDKLVKLPSPKVLVTRASITSAYMDQMIPLKKIDCKRLKESPADDNDCYTCQYKHCNTLISFPWKVNGKIFSRPADGLGVYHTVHAQRYLEKCFNEPGRSSIEQCKSD